ncbi:hypothetical protein MX167_001806 [Campylobacter upsaliensis]|nr:hypothetical protein [Campylobacter upsaliensis]
MTLLDLAQPCAAATQKALNLAFFVKLFCLAHASSSPYKRSSDPPLLNAALFMRLA